MWIKGVGAALLVGVGALYAFSYAGRLRTTQKCMTAWLELLCRIKREISCFGTPLQRIFYELGVQEKRLLVPSGNESCADLASLCRASARTLTGRSRDLMCSLSREIGATWRQEQLQRLDYYIAELQKEKAALDAHVTERIRVCGTLSVCGALGVVLLFW